MKDQGVESTALLDQLIEIVTRQSSAATSSDDIDKLLYLASAQLAPNLDENTREKVFRKARAELTGLGPIQPLVDDDSISEIMVYGARQVYVERKGELLDTNIRFEDDEHVLRIIDRILHPLGLQVNRDSPLADARLPDGSRVNIAIPPVVLDGPVITIRKFLRNLYSVQQFVEMNSLTRFMAKFLEACVVSRLNIIITGNTSSGKTTLLNILTGFIPGVERIITIEDAAELQLQQKYIVRMESRAPNVDGIGGGHHARFSAQRLADAPGSNRDWGGSQW